MIPNNSNTCDNSQTENEEERCTLTLVLSSSLMVLAWSLNLLRFPSNSWHLRTRTATITVRFMYIIIKQQTYYELVVVKQEILKYLFKLQYTEF